MNNVAKMGFKKCVYNICFVLPLLTMQTSSTSPLAAGSERRQIGSIRQCIIWFINAEHIPLRITRMSRISWISMLTSDILTLFPCWDVLCIKVITMQDSIYLFALLPSLVQLFQIGRIIKNDNEAIYHIEAFYYIGAQSRICGAIGENE